LKFRACRDARRVTGDAMEVRGGCGYIEEWSDPRLVRDAHLGSIWEGTSNIVALDVMRAIVREDSLPVLRAHLAGLLASTGLHPHVRSTLDDLLGQACAFAEGAAQSGTERLARQAATGLYNLTSAIAMAWEASTLRSVKRMTLAQLVIQHRLLPKDPLQAVGKDIDAAVLFGSGTCEDDPAALDLLQP
jgi:acyl-CoA dehydrogenase